MTSVTRILPACPYRRALHFIVWLVLLVLALTGCQAEQAPDPLPPDEYLDNALNWIEAKAIAVNNVDWPAVRAAAVALVPDPQTTADTYPAIEYALAELGDSLAWLAAPDEVSSGGFGMAAVYPDGVVLFVEKGGPAEKAAVQVGDIVEVVNGAPLQPYAGTSQVDLTAAAQESRRADLQLRRAGQTVTVSLERAEFEVEGLPTSRQLSLGEHTIAYLDLPWDPGSELYPTRVQEAMAAVDGPANCGWIVDLRRNTGGDLWSFLAGLGPILGEGKLGGFVYPDDSEEWWIYENGKVFWAEEERFESYVRGPIYTVAQTGLPVALLISRMTHAAPELVVVAFQEWGTVRTFGEASAGAPHLVLHTPLSDGAFLYASGAVGMDRTGRLYDGPIEPDEPVMIDWQKIGAASDPVVGTAQAWLADQPSCR